MYSTVVQPSIILPALYDLPGWTKQRTIKGLEAKVCDEMWFDPPM